MSKTATVVVTEDGCVPIPPEMREELRLLPSQPVQLRTEGDRLVVQRPSREEVVAELERLRKELRTGEPLSEIWAEVEAGRDEDRWQLGQTPGSSSASPRMTPEPSGTGSRCSRAPTT